MPFDSEWIEPPFSTVLEPLDPSDGPWAGLGWLAFVEGSSHISLWSSLRFAPARMVFPPTRRDRLEESPASLSVPESLPMWGPWSGRTRVSLRRLLVSKFADKNPFKGKLPSDGASESDLSASDAWSRDAFGGGPRSGESLAPFESSSCKSSGLKHVSGESCLGVERNNLLQGFSRVVFVLYYCRQLSLLVRHHLRKCGVVAPLFLVRRRLRRLRRSRSSGLPPCWLFIYLIKLRDQTHELAGFGVQLCSDVSNSFADIFAVGLFQPDLKVSNFVSEACVFREKIV